MMNIKDFLNLKKSIYQKCMTNIIFNPATVRSNHCNGRNKTKMLMLTAWLRQFEVRVRTGRQGKEIKMKGIRGGKKQ